MLRFTLKSPCLSKAAGKAKAAFAWFHAALHGAEWKRQAEEWKKRAEILAKIAKSTNNP